MAGNFSAFPPPPRGFILTREQLDSLKPFLYPGTIKKPFDPYHLKEGGRPLTWLEELYQKVLHFETTLTLPEWKKFVSQKIEPHFKRGDKLLLNKELKDVLFNLLTQKPSPLRRLEIFCLQAPPSEPGVEKTEERKPPSPPVLIKDSFVAKPEEIQKKAAMDKLFYHYEQQPKGDDAANLNFLDELANREEEAEDEEKDKKP